MKKRIIAMLAAAAIIIGLCAACSEIAGIRDYFLTLHGQLVGNDYKIAEYDNYGNLVFTAYGTKVAMNGQVDESGELTSYIDIIIDGHDWKHVGATLLFVQDGVDVITDFQIPDDMTIDQSISTGFMPADRYINEYKNFFGKSMYDCVGIVPEWNTDLLVAGR